MEKQFHICVVANGFPNKKIPQYTFVEQLCRSLADYGWKVTVIAPQSVTKCIIRREGLDPYFRTEYTEAGNGIDVYRPRFFSVGEFKWLGKEWNARRFSAAVSRAFRAMKQKPDVCYGHFWDCAFAVYRSARKFRIPLFVACGEAELTIFDSFRPETLSRFSEYVSGVICVSTKNLQESVSTGLTVKEKCRVIPNAIDPSRFYRKNKLQMRRQFGFDAGDFIVAFVGGFIHRKGTRRIAEAISLLDDSSVKSLFIGKTMGSDACDPECKGILFKGCVPHDRIADYLNCADVFVMPTLHEGCCNANIEAMACGLPIISSDLPFNYDVLDSSFSILIDPMDIRQIAEAIRTLKDDPQRRRKMAEAALEHARQYTLERRAEQIIGFIKECINQPVK